MEVGLNSKEGEYVLSNDDVIVSKTDLFGNITYVNDDFLRISGFSESELLGYPQNTVRHPDMPHEAFADLWQTIKGGGVWVGIVKNKCKNGDFYWVEATITPIIANREIVGYASIRVKPDQVVKSTVENAYLAINNRDKSVSIQGGKVLKRKGFDIFRLPAINFDQKLLCSFVFLFLIFAAIALCLMTRALDTFLVVMRISVAVGFILTAFLMLLVYREILVPLRNFDSTILLMSEGNLTESIAVTKSNDISGCLHSMKILQTNVKLLIGQIKQSSSHLHLGVNHIAKGIVDLSSRTESQASALQETASAMDEITSTVAKNAENSERASRVMVATSTVTQAASNAVLNLISTIDVVKESTYKMSEIISVVDEIAFQTNILALNASIEAARAGPNGRGFAVVANEVRNLAQRSANAAKEIKCLIDDSISQVDAGKEMAQNTGEKMKEISEEVIKSEKMLHEISIASKEQSAGIKEINLAISHMDDITQKNANLVDESVVAANSLRSLAEILNGLVSTFKLTNGSNNLNNSIKVVQSIKRLSLKQ
ncbi:methyl-accepting chemotaxis protein [Undibacterium crateris]|uniref:methyl-accepting chemotaxis protein n=1 Tax=Undibacterium crateris TaxID=2528175 RepID=UPI001389872F|nr:PAS domain-containing methyl-accepting chemotaxis protein [Undibacterium crateris]NDI87601.1 PAS domain S-box protein [Undibacterium crateris]